MGRTTAQGFLFIDCNPFDGVQIPKRVQSSAKRSHAVRESNRQSRAKRLAALKADNEANGILKICSIETGFQSTGEQPMTKHHFLESAKLANRRIEEDESGSNGIMLHKNKLLGPLGTCELDPWHVYPLGSNLPLYVDGLIDYGAPKFQYLVQHRSKTNGSGVSPHIHLAIPFPLRF
jgi:hypothetical protein